MTQNPDGARVHTVIGVDAGSADLREADHLVHHLVTALNLPPETVACTHLVRTDSSATTALSLALPNAESAEAAWGRLAGVLADADLVSAGAVLADRSFGSLTSADHAATAAHQHLRGTAGRAVVFPGVELLTDVVTVRDILADTAVGDLVVIGAPSGRSGGLDPATRILTRDHVRPELRDGQLVLTLTPAPDGAFAPFELPNPTPCCADH